MFPEKWTRFIATLCLASLTACSTTGSFPPVPSMQDAPSAGTYTIKDLPQRGANEIAPGYKIRLASSSDSSLNGTFQIEFDGTLKIPYRVELKTNNLSWETLKADIRNSYRKFFKGKPDLQMSIVERDVYVDVRGLVETPGKILVKQNSTLDEVISKVKGLQTVAQEGPLAKFVRIESQGISAVMKLSDYYTGATPFAANWIGGEAIFFQSERGAVSTTTGLDPNYIRLLGEVRAPGEFLAKSRNDFYYYFSRAGGPTAAADPENVTLVRKIGSKTHVYDFDLNHPDSLPPLYGGDVVIVNANRTTSIQRNSSLIATIAGILSSMATVLIAYTVWDDR